MDEDLMLQSIWEVEQEILDVIDDVCKKNKLKYSLAYGTLIGAIRHKGFIPWDDDIDIMMPRDDYNKLLEIWEKEAPDDYIIQNYNKDLDYCNNFTKIRKNNTTFLQQKSEVGKKYHKGIFVDIFPGDCVASGKIKRRIQYVACAINLLYSRGFSSGRTGLIGVIEKILLIVPSKFYPVIRKVSEHVICSSNKIGGTYLFFPCTIECCKKYYPENMFDDLQRIEFNGKKYYAVKDFDEILRIEYGDYMKLPSKEERQWKHHPILVDFERNFEQIKGGRIC